jgi:hypothetical protein
MNVKARQPMWVEVFIDVVVLAMLLVDWLGDKGPAI